MDSDATGIQYTQHKMRGPNGLVTTCAGTAF
jgi:hypothetical protein